MIHFVQNQAFAYAGFGDKQPLYIGEPEEQLVHKQTDLQELRFAVGNTESSRAFFYGVVLDFVDEPVEVFARNFPQRGGERRAGIDGGYECVGTDRYEVLDLFQVKLVVERAFCVADEFFDVPAGIVKRAEHAFHLLLNDDGAEPHAVRAGHLAFFDEHELRGAAAHLKNKGVLTAHGAVCFYAVGYGQIGEAVVFNAVYDPYVEACFDADAVKHRIPVLCLAHGACGDDRSLSGTDAPSGQLLPEPHEYADALEQCIPADGTGGEHVIAERQGNF